MPNHSNSCCQEYPLGPFYQRSNSGVQALGCYQPENRTQALEKRMDTDGKNTLTPQGANPGPGSKGLWRPHTSTLKKWAGKPTLKEMMRSPIPDLLTKRARNGISTTRYRGMTLRNKFVKNESASSGKRPACIQEGKEWNKELICLCLLDTITD